jgi:hypothetical protein
MRSFPLIVLGLALSSCAGQPTTATRTAENQIKLDKLLAGKVAGAPITCLPNYQANDMIRIDDSTIAFKRGSRVYVNHLRGACSNLTSGFYSLVTRSSGQGLCRGDIAEVRDNQTGTIVGACGIGNFIPYSNPG